MMIHGALIGGARGSLRQRCEQKQDYAKAVIQFLGGGLESGRLSLHTFFLQSTHLSNHGSSSDLRLGLSYSTTEEASVTVLNFHRVVEFWLPFFLLRHTRTRPVSPIGTERELADLSHGQVAIKRQKSFPTIFSHALRIRWQLLFRHRAPCMHAI
jgi:hypothetical protein